MAETERLIDAVALILEEREPPTEEALRQIVRAQAAVIQMTDESRDRIAFLDGDIEGVVKVLQTKFSIRMEVGNIFEAEDYKPWLIGRQGDIVWYYSDRYKKHLRTTKEFPPRVVHTLDGVTDKVLDHLEDPGKEGAWSRRGLVVGHVQSGKTANYTGLICKAADAGYKVIIVLAGLLNSLRNQTQERIDSDFMGWCTRNNKRIGASRFSSNKRRPVCLTTVVEDFNLKTANTQLQLAALNEPIILVLKKNKNSLEKLHEWLSGQNEHDLRDFSMLMIDDEADHASVNTNKEDKDPTTINLAIRNLLHLFDRSSYVGYTATPFANIFIDPKNEDEMRNGEVYKDLFPRDFILSLDPPNNYVGPHRIFTDDADLDSVRSVDDHEDYLPIRHKIDFVPDSLPPSLVGAIECFVIARAIRLLRGQEGKHHSMMINASRFTGVQNLLKGLVSDLVKDIRRSVGNYSALPEDDALKNPSIRSLHATWHAEFASLEFSWSQVQGMLKTSLDPIEVMSVNSSPGPPLDYNPDEYPNGRSVIAVGGLGLSRGLTLEGLVVSYFLRNSIMYDTLMQMGRWFGYRDGFADVCRIFMTDGAFGWYAHIAEATEELRADFRGMEKAKLTPLQFGLRVRSHPTALIVTARNKMRTAREVPVSISLAGRLTETSVIFGGKSELDANHGTLEKAVKESSEAGELDKSCKLGFLWKRVPSQIVRNAVISFQNHPECMLTYPEPLVEYIDWLSAEGQEKFDVLLRAVAKNENDAHIQVAGFNFYAPIRTVLEISQSRIAFTKRRVASKGDERAGLAAEEIADVKARFEGSNIPDKKYREVVGRAPLLMINFVAVMKKDDDRIELIAPTYGLSFPGGPASGQHLEKTVQYRVNTVWWQKNFFMPDEEEEGD
jgi:hypothetical protein